MSDSITLEDFYKLFQRSQEATERSAAEFDRELAESRAEFDRRAAKFDRELAESRAEFDRRAAKFDRELAESRAEFDRRAAKFDRELAESTAEFDRRAAEADRRAAKFDRELAESRAEFDRRGAEIDRRIAEFNQQLAKSKAENDRGIKEMRQGIASLTSRWGQFVENVVAPGVLRLFQERGINVQEVSQRMRSARGSRHLEIDVFAVDDDVAVVVEVKSRLTQSDVRQVLNTLTHFKTAFPHYASYQIYGAVAAIEIDKDVDTYAYNQGLFVIVQSGDSVKISNSLSFSPRIW